MSVSTVLTMATRLKANAREFEDQPVRIFQGRSVSDGQFLDRANELASPWSRRGLKGQDPMPLVSRTALEICDAAELPNPASGRITNLEIRKAHGHG